MCKMIRLILLGVASIVKPGDRRYISIIVRRARVVDKDKHTQIAYTPILMEGEH